ncbi:MAG: ABC transporter transmembrane domain-containing protein, partial [Gemmatimonadales bacterium]
MRTELRLLRLVAPYRGLLAIGLITTFLASIFDGFTLVILIPLLKHLFGTAGELRTGSTRLEGFVDRLIEPFIAGLTPNEVAGRLVVVLAVSLLLKNLMSYTSTQVSVRAQEGLVRDLRTRIFAHLLTLDFGYFQRTRAGQLLSGIITEVDQTKTVITASLLSLFRNVVAVAVTLVVLSQISIRLTLLMLAFVPLLLVLLQALLGRLRRHSRMRTHERGEVTALVSERIGSIRLIRSYGEEPREAARFAQQADRYRKQIIRTQRFSSLTSPVSEVFSGFLVILIIGAGTRPGLIGLSAPLAPEVIIVFLMAALKLTSPLKTISSFPAVMAVGGGGGEGGGGGAEEGAERVGGPGAVRDNRN